MNQWLFQKLERWLSDLSQKELENLDYDKFAIYVGITTDEANEYFKFLKKNNFIIEKQISCCPNCGEECVIDTSLYENEFECEECEEILEYNKLRRHSTVLYKINKEYIESKENRIRSQFADDDSNIVNISSIRSRKKDIKELDRSTEMKVKVFLSYCHEDEEMKKELDKSLVMLKRNNKIDTWNDRCIVAGKELEKEILENLRTANIILLLVSQDFLASSYCFEKEMKIALERHQNNEAVVIPVILRRCDWLNSELSKIAAVPRDGKPIKAWNDTDEAYFETKQEIERAVNEYIDRLGW